MLNAQDIIEYRKNDYTKTLKKLYTVHSLTKNELTHKDNIM